MKKNIIIILCLIIMASIMSFCDDDDSGGTTFTEINSTKKYNNNDELINDINRIVQNISYREDLVEQAVLEGEIEIDTLPDISGFEIVTGSNKGYSNRVQIEIFSSTEKSTPKNAQDRWLYDVANDFNNAQIRLSDGRIIEILVRNIASGTGYEFIKARKYIPDAFTPSNSLWIRMIEASGIKTKLIAESLVPNYAGLVITKDTEKLLKETYGDVSFKSIVDAVIKKKISAAYTDPKSSSTGLNMLYTILYELAEGDTSKIFSDKIINSFEVFQEKVPLIATTTLHLRDLFEQGGKLEAFPTEYQTYQRMTDKNNLTFVPFGTLHSNPLYALETNLTPEKEEGLRKLAEFAKSTKYEKLAEEDGFVKINYNGIKEPDGNTLLSAQKIWKEHKDSGRTVYAYFLTDTSGSMDYVDPVTGKTRLAQLKVALEQASKFINKNNHIGIMEFNSGVVNRLNLASFDVMQRGRFLTAVRNLTSEGSTAMYDGIASCLIKLVEQKKKDPNGKYYLFVLTDGETNTGHNYNDLLNVMVGSDIRIYPIAYGEVNNEELKKLATIGETGLITGSPENIIQKLMSLFDLSL